MSATDWKIRVQGYGTFTVHATEDEAEEVRALKARWERGVAHKWRADLSRESDRLTAEMARLWDHGKGVPKALMRRRSAAILRENDQESLP